MNVADADDISSRLSALGGRRITRPEQADLVLVNTCTVRQKAEEKARSFFGGLKHARDSSGKLPYLVGMGCLIPGAGAAISQTYPHLDLLINYSDPDIVLAELIANFPPLANFSLEDSHTPLIDSSQCQLTFVTAIRGCNHGCSFCAVPGARGPQRDVPLDRIVAEAKAHEAAGSADICLLGQNILAYGRTSGDRQQRFIEMMQAVLDNTGFPWVTFLTSLACDLTDEICEQVIAHPRVTPLLHLPVQSGSDKVLGDMRRRHDVAQYKRVVAKARECRPDLYLTTDLLVGFPTETEAEFKKTLELVEEVGFDDAFMFAYSERPGTHSARNYPDTIKPEDKSRRLSTLIAKQRESSRKLNQRFAGQVLPVIIEKAQPGKTLARTAFNKPVRLPTSVRRAGEYSLAKITSVKGTAFTGEEVVSG